MIVVVTCLREDLPIADRVQNALGAKLPGELMIKVDHHKIGAGSFQQKVIREFLEKSNDKYLYLIEDDVEFFGPISFDGVPENALASMYTPSIYAGYIHHFAGWGEFCPQQIMCGMQAIRYTREVCELVAGVELVGVDQLALETTVFPILRSNNIPCYYHNPSLCQHIGYQTTQCASIWHEALLSGV